MSDDISIKVVLKDDSKAKEEARRIIIKRTPTGMFASLSKKLCSLFPSIVMRISWADDEGDLVTVSSDHELGIAIQDMRGPVYKLFVQIDGSTCSPAHDGVICDGCDVQPIVGDLYRCTICDDYLLCKNCREDKNLHPGHRMTKDASRSGAQEYHPRQEGVDYDHHTMLNRYNHTSPSAPELEQKENEWVKDGPKEAKAVSLPSIPECTVCLEELTPPLRINHCRNGHLICSPCRDKVDRCTVCRQEYTGRATAVEQMMREMFRYEN